MDSIIFKIG